MAALPPAPDALLEKTWHAIGTEDPADAVLRALALTRAMHRAGTRAVEEGTAPVPCAEDDRGVLGPGAVDSLVRMLKGEFREVLPEWLGLAVESGRVAPGRVLPELLAEATKDHSLRPVMRRLTGERGKWIAARHGKFSWITEEQAVTDGSWEDGTPGERIAWLGQARAADPVAAMDAVSATWSGEEVTMREAVVRLISRNPLPGDEAWLDQAMNDRRQEVRDLAAVSLAVLATSAFRQRALGRIRAHVGFQRKLLKRVLVVEPPAAFDPSWAADGIKEKPPQGTGEKAWWLGQLFAMVPLDEWPALLDCASDDMFGLAIDPDWQEPLVSGWLDAARRFPARSLPEQFVPFVVAREPWPAAAGHRSVVIAQVLEALSAERRFALLDAIVGKLARETALDLLARFREAPPPGTGRAVLAVIDGALAEKTPAFHRQQARALALCIPRDEIRQRLELIARLPELPAATEEFAITLEFRRNLLSHFKTP